jgi:hypothetical protein
LLCVVVSRCVAAVLCTLSGGEEMCLCGQRLASDLLM